MTRASVRPLLELAPLPGMELEVGGDYLHRGPEHPEPAIEQDPLENLHTLASRHRSAAYCFHAVLPGALAPMVPPVAPSG